MSKEACIIKGTREGLSILIPASLEIHEVIEQLRARLHATQHFFEGAVVNVLAENRDLQPAEKREIAKAVEEFGLVMGNNRIYKPEPKAVNAVNENELLEDTLLIRRTLRSGQRVQYDGNVVVLGDVNPGAEIVCSGDILVLGSLRGVAHAGCNGNVRATVFALRLEPTQLRIANYISRSPDEDLPQPVGPELARVTDNMIQISAYSFG